jgi:hypothetical protein
MSATISTKDKQNIINTMYNDWFLPSIDELNAMYTELHLYAVGGFGGTGINNLYCSSSEASQNTIREIDFSDGSTYNSGKSSADHVRACRAFTTATAYNLRDFGPAGGYIFWKSGNNYLEATLTDQSIGKIWSNVYIGLIGTETAIGTGQANTIAIINQVGHTDSAAKLCDDLVA